MIDTYCNGDEAEVQIVKTKTAEEFYYWMERKVRAIRRHNEQTKQQQAQAKSRTRGH